MSIPYPRRVVDLALELDSEEEFNTPAKPRKGDKRRVIANNEAEEMQNDNKENEPNNTKSFTQFGNSYMYPKRSSELPTLESDSEEEDAIKNDNLNCAILNDSFIMSPYKSELDESGTQLKQTDETLGSRCNKSFSFVSNFNRMQIHSDLLETTKEGLPKPPATEHCSTARKGLAGPPPLQSILEDEAITSGESNNVGDMAPATSVKSKVLETPFKTEGSEAQFVTPQVRSFSVRRRPRDLCSAQSQKQATATGPEFRSQKVLFQTPMAMQRQPCVANDSLMSSLYDTINESAATPCTSETNQKRRNSKGQEQEKAAKTKKSLEIVFNEVDKDQKATHQGDSQTSSEGVDKESSNLIKINNVEYAIEKKLGCGGSSSVYLAQRKDNGKECALKVVDLRGDPAVVEGYLNETKLLAKLQGNMCVVSLYDYQLLQQESRLFMVMEKGDSDLHKILQSYTTKLPLYVLMNFLYQMLQAVNYIHQNGVIHSDLKPANFLMVNGRLKLIDFGIASNIALDSTSIIKFSQAGTFNYISPEALIDTSTGSSPIRNNQPKIKISTKSDVWSLGCILYLLMFQKTPFSDIKNVYAKISAISNPSHTIEYPAIPPYYPVMLTDMVKSCLQHNPKKRPSCAELLQYPFNMVIPIQHLTVPPRPHATQT